MFVTAKMYDYCGSGKPEHLCAVERAERLERSLGCGEVKTNDADIRLVKVENRLVAHVAQRQMEKLLSLPATKQHGNELSFDGGFCGGTLK